MKALLVAIGIALAVCALLFGLFHAFGVADKVAGPLASSGLGFITFIHDKVDKAYSAGRSHVTPGIVPLHAFDIRWPFTLVYSTLIFIAIVEVANALNLLPAFIIMEESPTLPVQSVDAVVALASIPTIGLGCFVLGRWIGIRSARSGYWILPLGMLLGRVIEAGGMWVAIPYSRQAFRNFGHSSIAVTSGALLFLSLAAVGVLGVWRGNKVRFGAYFNSLLNQVPAPTRELLLAMTFEEAKAGTTAHPQP